MALIPMCWVPQMKRWASASSMLSQTLTLGVHDCSLHRVQKVL